MNKFFNIIFGRILYTALFVILQIAALVVMFLYFSENFAYFYIFCLLISAIVLLHLMYKNGNPEYKLAWVIPILVFPIFGGFLYLMFSQNRLNDTSRKKIMKFDEYYKKSIDSDENTIKKLENENKEAAIQSRYIQNTAHSFPWQKTQTKYLKIGEEFFESVINDLKNAKKFIFLEYFIIEEGVMWNSILDILRQKQKEGVEIRIMYDDFGCMFKLPQNYHKKLQSYGFKVHVFHKFNNILRRVLTIATTEKFLL